MAWPVSIGDAVMLSKLAYRIGVAFTSGRKSAPAEFEEIKDQLFTLANALEFLAIETSRNSSAIGVSSRETREESKKSNDNEDILGRMISNCRQTLKHLERLVDKYTEIDPNVKYIGQTTVRRWQHDIMKNWKKIRWTTEGGDLGKLRNNLTVHINGLNLAFSALRSTQTRSIETQLNGVDDKLSEIFEWYTKNLKHPKVDPASNSTNGPSQSAPEADSSLMFEVFAELPGNAVMGLICPKASFRRDWYTFRNRDESFGLFQCHCVSNEGIQYPEDLSSKKDHTAYLRFFLLPVTLITRLTGFSNLWQLYTLWGASNGSISLILGGIASSNLAKFRHCVEQLAIEQAKGLGENHFDSMLMHYMSDGVQESIRILDSKSDGRQYTGKISKITFIVEDRRFTEESIGSVELLHYQSLSLPNTTLLHQRHAELIIRPAPSKLRTTLDQNTHQYIVNIEYDTELTKQSHSPLVRISRVECSEETDHSEPGRISHADIELEFINSSVAESFITSLKAMQKELFVLYLCFPRAGEKVIFQRSMGDLMIRDFYLPDATLSVVRDPIAKENRMMLLSHCTSIGVCMKLPSSFNASSQNNTNYLNNEYPAYFVRITRDKTLITEQPTGFGFILPVDEGARNQFLHMIAQMSIEDGHTA